LNRNFLNNNKLAAVSAFIHGLSILTVLQMIYLKKIYEDDDDDADEMLTTTTMTMKIVNIL